jgi:hypothetical protein
MLLTQTATKKVAVCKIYDNFVYSLILVRLDDPELCESILGDPL